MSLQLKSGKYPLISSSYHPQVEAFLAAFEAAGGGDGDGEPLDYLAASPPPSSISLQAEVAMILTETQGLIDPPSPSVADEPASKLGSQQEDQDTSDAAEDSHLDEGQVLQQALDSAAVEAAQDLDEAAIGIQSTEAQERQDLKASPASVASLLAALSTPSTLPLQLDLEAGIEDPTFARLLSLKPSLEIPKDKAAVAGPKGATPKPLDIAGWRAARDDAVESWCGASTERARLFYARDGCALMPQPQLIPFWLDTLGSHLLVRRRAPLPRLRR